MNTTTFHFHPFEATFDLLHKVELGLARAFKTFYAALDAAHMCEQGQTVKIQDLKRLGLID